MRTIELRQAGLSYAQICTVLNTEQVPTPMGGSRWLKSHVDRLLHTHYVRDIMTELLRAEPTCASASTRSA